ncbi:hypothetical protein [Flagellimonas sp. CMM7]|uniref:hypothetical protein n=1 Tax=Flagellimonas sp. CMM7 TaxID=2654676 RepID=UPI0013D6A557|nr:hypothetical protein [Flagellimonas sp. CMM7]UII78601.1 hypothetical protein LV704_13105 [Flagellimonas sp. CMM7]
MFIIDVKDKKIGLLKLDHNDAIIYQRKDDFNMDSSKKHKHTDDWKKLGVIKNYLTSKKKTDDHQFFKKIIKEVAGFDFLLIASHGKGSANEGENLEAYMDKHCKHLSEKIVGHIATHNHRTENELLSEADTFLNFRW